MTRYDMDLNRALKVQVEYIISFYSFDKHEKLIVTPGNIRRLEHFNQQIFIKKEILWKNLLLFKQAFSPVSNVDGQTTFHSAILWKPFSRGNLTVEAEIRKIILKSHTLSCVTLFIVFLNTVTFFLVSVIPCISSGVQYWLRYGQS